MPPTPPLRVILWGTGTVSAAIARAIARRGDLILVGARTSRAEDDGRNLGALLGEASSAPRRAS